MRTWTEAGEKWSKSGVNRAHIERKIKGLQWHKLEDGLNGPMSPVLSLQAIMDDIKGTHLAVSWSGVLFDRYGLLGLETRYRNGLCHSYWIDAGVGCTCLCSDFSEWAQLWPDRWIDLCDGNTWIKEAWDPPVSRDTFHRMPGVAELAYNLGRTWCLGQAFWIELEDSDPVAFVNQIGGGNEWWAVRGLRPFESLSGWAYADVDKLGDFLERVQVASDDQLKRLSY